MVLILLQLQVLLLCGSVVEISLLEMEAMSFAFMFFEFHPTREFVYFIKMNTG